MSSLIDTFCNAFSQWDGAGQGLFVLVVLGGIGTLIIQAMHYIGVFFHGWPDKEESKNVEE